MRSFTVWLKIFLDGDAFPVERSLIRLFYRIESGKGVDAENGSEALSNVADLCPKSFS